jgi:hypothetical protein
MSVVVSLDCKAVRNTGSHGSPVWNEMPGVKDVTVPLSWVKADASSRASRIRMSEPTLADWDFTLSMVHDPADADLEALRDAHNNRTSIDMAFLDGPAATPGSQGPRASFKVFKFERAEPLEGIAMVNIEISPCHNTTNPPAYYEVP